MKNVYRIAGKNVEIEHSYSYFSNMAQSYLYNDEPDFIITVTDADMEKEKGWADSLEYPDFYLESLAIYRKLCNKLIDYGTILFHSTVVAVDGKAYMFAAPSGTGKSTHTSLWRELFGERAVMVNDDKPLITVCGDRITVHGTPWNGKANLGSNMSAQIAGICFISRGEKNSIERMEKSKILPLLMSQTYRPESKLGTAKMMSTLTGISSNIPIWRLYCNMDVEAAQIAYNAMSNV